MQIIENITIAAYLAEKILLNLHRMYFKSTQQIGCLLSSTSAIDFIELKPKETEKRVISQAIKQIQALTGNCVNLVVNFSTEFYIIALPLRIESGRFASLI